jgi:hypothetical protein
MRKGFVLACLLSFLSSTAEAADVLFVSDVLTDVNIPDALRADGHDVTVVTNDFDFSTVLNRALLEDLSAYDCVVWSATGYGFGAFHDPAVFENLSGYVEAGGRVFVTGFGSVGYSDTELVAFLGGTSGSGYTGTPRAILGVDNSLTVGVVDLLGVTPTAYEFQYEGLLGLGSDTVAVVSGDPTFGGPAAQWTLRTLGLGEIAYVANGSGSSFPVSWTASGSGAAGAYNGALRNFVASADASAGDPGAPRVRLVGRFSAPEGSSVEVEAEIVDEEGDEFTFSWDLDGDGTYGEASGEATVTVTLGDGEGTLTLGVQAVDALGNTAARTRRLRIENAAPMIVSEPPSVASIAENVQYRIVAEDPAGEADTLTYELVRGPSSASMVGAVFRFVPTEGDVTPVGDGVVCEVAVSDEDGGRTTQVWTLEIQNNYAPQDLTIEYPRGDVALYDRTPRLAVRGGTDIDGDSLTYFFELDVVSTFDSPALVRSGPIDEQPGFTTFQITEPLGDGRYFWRAWLSDGEAETEPQTASFYVIAEMGEVAADAGSDASPPDAGAVTPPVDRGCACRASRSGGGAGATLLLTALVAVLLRRRR